MRSDAFVALCAIAICGCGASTAGSTRGTETTGAQAPPNAGSASGALSVAPPPSVKRAGGDRLAEFELGRAVVERSGCLGCHRIGDAGPPQPGPALTHIGSIMPAHTIERVLIDAEPPMPSFRRLPRAQLSALIRFLSLLRCPGADDRLMRHGC